MELIVEIASYDYEHMVKLLVNTIKKRMARNLTRIVLMCISKNKIEDVLIALMKHKEIEAFILSKIKEELWKREIELQIKRVSCKALDETNHLQLAVGMGTFYEIIDGAIKTINEWIVKGKISAKNQENFRLIAIGLAIFKEKLDEESLLDIGSCLIDRMQQEISEQIQKLLQDQFELRVEIARIEIKK